jgi:hypothetical protein
VRNATVGQGGAAGEVDHVLDVGRAHDARAVLGYVAKQVVGLDVLLGMRRDQVVIRHAGDREHRRLVELGVVERVQQVHGAGARRGQTHAQTSRELGVRARHEGGGLLVSYLHEAQAVLPLA